MNRNGWIAISVLVVVMALSLWWMNRNTNRWDRRNAELVVEVERFRQESADAEARVDEALKEKERIDKEKAKIADDLAAARAEIKRLRPKSLAECITYLNDCEKKRATLILSLDLEELTSASLADALVYRTTQADANEAAWLAEQKRAEGWRKLGKRQRIGMGFIGVGAGLVGGLAGYGVAAARQ